MKRKKLPDRSQAKSDTDRAALLQQVAARAMSSIADMVAALQCDYDRLEELQARRDDWVPAAEYEEGSRKLRPTDTWGCQNPADAFELRDLEEAAGDCRSRDDADRIIHEDPLSVQVRSDWRDVGAEDDGPVEYEILLSTGGPATRIIGDLRGGEPSSAMLQAQDWFQPWTNHADPDYEILLAYARCFYFDC